MVNFKRPEIDIQSVEAEVLGPMRERTPEPGETSPSEARMTRQWREFQAREQWRAERLRAD